MGGLLAARIAIVHRTRFRLMKCRDSAPLALTAAFQSYDLAARRRLDEALWQLLGNPEQAFPTRHLGPDFLGIDARGYPEHDEIVDEIGAFPDDGVGVATHRVDHHLDGFLSKFLGHLGAARTQQPRRPRGGRIPIPGGQYSLV